MRVGDGDDGQARLAHEAEVLQPGLGLDGSQCHWLLDGLDRLHVDGDEPARFVGGVGIGRLDHLGDAHDLLALVGMVEEAAVARLHRLEVHRGLGVADAGPGRLLVLDELRPGICRRL